MSLVKKLSIAMLLIVLLLSVTVITLLRTECGLHFLLNRTFGLFTGLQIASISGSWKDLNLKGIKYQIPGMILKAGQLNTALHFSCLKNKEICINTMTVEDVVVIVNSKSLPFRNPSSDRKPLTDIRTPYPIILKLLSLHRVKIIIDNKIISLEAIQTAVHWKQRLLSLMPTKINGLLISNTLPSVEKLVSTKKLAENFSRTKLVKNLKTFFDTPLLPKFLDFSFPLDIQIKEILVQRICIKGNQDFFIQNFLLKGSIQGQHLQLEDLQIKSPQYAIYAKGNLTLSDKWPLNILANSTLNIAHLKEEKIKIKLAGDLMGKLALAWNISGTVSAKLKAKIQLSEIGLPLSATLQINKLVWPLTSDKKYQVRNFNMRFDGKITDYALSLSSDFKGQNLPSAQCTIEGKGNLAQFDITALCLSALQGNIHLTGIVDWRNSIKWNQILIINGINTTKQWPAWPAKLSGKIVTQGNVNRDGNWKIQISELTLNGNIKQKKLIARGSMRGNSSGQWYIPAINLKLGRNTFTVKGYLEKNLVLDARLDAPELHGILPGLDGIVKGVVKLRGSLKNPQVLADLSARRLQWQKLGIKVLNISGNVHLHERMESHIFIKMEQFKQENFLIHGLTLSFTGSEKKHQFNLKFSGHPMTSQVILNGVFDRQQQRWLGNLSKIYINTPLGEWHLNHATKLEYLNIPKKIIIGSHCWSNDNAELCTIGRIEISELGKAHVLIKHFDLGILKPFLDSDTHLSGIFTGQGNFLWKSNDVFPRFNIDLCGRNLKVQQKIQNNLVPIDFDIFNLKIVFQKGNLQIDWLIKPIENGKIHGRLKIDQSHSQNNLLGYITISDVSLKMINPILNYEKTASVIMNSKLRLSGNLNNPLMYGKLELDKVVYNDSWMPFKINTGRLLINFNGMTSKLSGLIHTAKGNLNLIGEANWSTPDAWYAKVIAKGEKLFVILPPMLQAEVSPDLVFVASPKSLKLNGRVDIPWARVLIEQIPEDVVTVSSSSVMLNNQLQPIVPRNTTMAIHSNLNILLGSDVHIDAFGLQAQLQGALKVVQDKSGLGLHGQITIPQGMFHAYEQDLIVKKGELLFSGPAEQPLLNIDAIRNPNTTENKVTAGVLVTGMVDALRVEVYSDPTMSQQEALSYLLQGQGLTRLGVDGDMMTSILIGIGVEKSGKLIGKIGEAFGVSNLRLGTEGVGNSSKVIVSGNVTKNLQVKYGVGIFDSLASFTIRYQLLPKLYLEAVSSIHDTLDMLYQLEF